MKISIFYDHIREIAKQRGIPLSDALKMIKELGIDYVELDGGSVTDRTEQKSILENADLKVGGMYYFFDFGHRSQPEERKKVAELAACLGAACVMAVPGFFEPGEDRTAIVRNMTDELNLLCHDTARYGIGVTMEDFDSDRSPCGTPGELNRFFDQVPELGATFDTGNFIYHNADVSDALEKLLPKIRHVHLKDRAFAPRFGNHEVVTPYGKKLHPAPVGSGDLPMEELVSRIQASGYNGIYAIEHFGGEDQYAMAASSAAWLHDMEKKTEGKP